jgi:acetyl esterase/lipase
MYLPLQCANQEPRGLDFFVHGGAWGSGSPNQYRLVAKPVLEKGLAVAVIGYRTYPDADVSNQVRDLELAASELTRRYPSLCLGATELGVTAIGHSSGAHILGMMLLERLRRSMDSSRWL